MKPSQLPGGVCSAIAAISAHVHVGLIKHNNKLCPHRYPFTPGWREAKLSVLLKDTSTTVAARIRTHILTTQPSEHKSDALNHLTMALHNMHSHWLYFTVFIYSLIYTGQFERGVGGDPEIKKILWKLSWVRSHHGIYEL